MWGFSSSRQVYVGFYPLLYYRALAVLVSVFGAPGPGGFVFLGSEEPLLGDPLQRVRHFGVDVGVCCCRKLHALPGHRMP